MLCLQQGLPGGEGYRQIRRRRRNAEIARKAGGKQRDRAYVLHIPIRIEEKFRGGSQEARTPER